MSAKKKLHEQAAEDVAALAKSRIEQGLAGHHPAPLHREVSGVAVHAVGGRVFVEVGDVEVELDQTAVGNLLHVLQAAFQAVS